MIATGVEFSHGEDETVHVAHATQEVVVSAGYEIFCLFVPNVAQYRPLSAPKSPQILELSGIGRRDILRKIGVPVKLELEGVGENAQEHLCTGVSFRSLLSTPQSTRIGC